MGLRTKYLVFLEMWERHYGNTKKISQAYTLAEQEYQTKIGHRAYSSLACFQSSRNYHNKKLKKYNKN